MSTHQRPATPHATLRGTRWQLQLVLDGLWDRERDLRSSGIDATDPRLVELIELRATVESELKQLARQAG